jgi:hypothetical protein
MRWRLVQFSVGLTVALTSFAEASTLYTLDAAGQNNLYVVDPQTGLAALPPFPASFRPVTWNDLAAVPGDSTALFAVHNPRPPLFEDPQTSRIARIDLQTGALTLFPLFDETSLGFAEPFSHAIAISKKDKSTAVVAGAAVRERRMSFLWRVDLDDGQVLGPAVPIVDGRGLRSMTYSLDGETLFGMDDEGRLVTVNPDTGELTIVGDPLLTDFVEGLGFDPYTEELYAIDAQSFDRLVRLDPQDGTLQAVIGSLGIVGPNGLAFVPLPGDANGDNRVDILDFRILKDHFATDAQLREGDFDQNGVVDIWDFNILKSQFGMLDPQSVPEPATIAQLCSAGLMALLMAICFRLSGGGITAHRNL